jgi:hypothetical protein
MRGSNLLAVAIASALVLAGASGIATAQTAPIDPTLQQEDPLLQDTQLPYPRFDYAVGLGYEHTDNIRRTASNQESQDILQPTFGFTLDQQGSTIQAQAVGLLQYQDYLQGTFANEYRGQLAGILNWTVSPQLLNLQVQDYSSVQPIDARAPSAPGNVQQVNVFVAGPTLLLGSSGPTHAAIDLRYVNTVASKTKYFNSDRGIAAFRLIRDLNPTDRLSGNVEFTHADFPQLDDPDSPQRYDSYNAYARYESRLSRLTLDVAAGASRVAFSNGFASHTNPLLRLSATWTLAPRNTLSLNLVDQLSDSTNNLTQMPDLREYALARPKLEVGQSFIVPTVFRDRGASVGYTYTGQRITLNIGSSYDRERQLNGTFDVSRNTYGALANIQYQLSPRSSLSLNAASYHTQYVLDGSHSRDQVYALGFNQTLTPHWTWTASLEHDQRRATNTLAGDSYHENMLFFTATYRR